MPFLLLSHKYPISLPLILLKKWKSFSAALKYSIGISTNADREADLAFLEVTGNDEEPAVHNRLENVEATYSSWPVLKEEPVEDADHEWYTDGSSFMIQGESKAGYAVPLLRKQNSWH